MNRNFFIFSFHKLIFSCCIKKIQFNLLHDKLPEFAIVHTTSNIKYISDGSSLEAPTVAYGIESMVVWSDQVHNYIPATIGPRPREPVNIVAGILLY